MAKKKNKVWFWALLCIIVAAGVGAWRMYRSGFQLNESTYIYIDTDDDVDSIAQKTLRQANPESMRVFHLYAGLLNLKDKIRTGRYEVTSDLTMLNFIRNIRNHNEKPVMLVVPSTRTMDKMAGKLANQLMADSTSIAQYLQNETNIPIQNLRDALKDRILVYSGGGSTYDFLTEPIDTFTDVRVMDASIWNEENIKNKKDVSNLSALLITAYGLSISSSDEEVKLKSYSSLFSHLSREDDDYIPEISKDQC